MSNMTSSFSSTMIGHGKSDHERHQTVNRHFREESGSILKRLETHHPAHRHKIMQVGVILIVGQQHAAIIV